MRSYGRYLRAGILCSALICVWVYCCRRPDLGMVRQQSVAKHAPKVPLKAHRLESAQRPEVQREAAKSSQAGPSAVAVVSSEALDAFTAWTERYAQAVGAEKAALIAEGVELAQARRPVFKELIQADPQMALSKAVPMVVRQKLPAEVLALLEERVNAVGALNTKIGVPMPGEPLPSSPLMLREAEFAGGKTYRAYVFGRRAERVESVVGASLNGVAVDAEFAVNEMPSRTLEPGEVPPATKPAVDVCPVSGLQTEAEEIAAGEPLPDATPAVETATQVVFFCDGAHILNYNEVLLLAEGGTGGAFGFSGILPAASTPALGVVKVLAIPMTYADQSALPATEATIYATLRDVSEFYSKASYGRLTLVGTVCPPVKLPHNEAWYVNRDTSNGGDISGTSVEHLHAREEARKLGFDVAEYDSIVVRHSGGPGSYGGLATLPGSTVWVRTDSPGTWAHEIGHSFGLLHANFWDTAGTSSIGNGVNAEYGHSYDIMGGSSFPAGHYNAQAKNQIKWLTSEFVKPVTASGTYRIYAFDQGALDPSRRYALTVLKDTQKLYWGEVRTLFDSNPWVKNGLVLGWQFPNGGGGNLQLIDTTNGSPFLKEDAPVSLGTTFSDTESGIHLTTVAVNDVPRYVDVQVNLGNFPSNQKPTLTLTASADVVPQNGTVTFTATASDPDLDELAYGWQHFGSSSTKIVSPNAAVITRQFPTAGTYVVSCTVSDMKGGTVTRNKLITVGNGGSTFTIAGRVTLQGQGLPDVVVTANGANGVITDADGYYVVPNLSANTYTLTPLLYGYAFSELFNNSVTVGPNFTGANFDASVQPTVTLTASTNTANELAPVVPGAFRLTRTGDTSQPLVVNVNTVSGTATKTTDYTLAPDYVAGSSGYSTFTIPADAATLDVVLTPVSDSVAEGPETATLQLGPGVGYVVTTPSVATVTLLDDDTTLPLVAVNATTADAVENGASPAVVTLTRTGVTTASLTVNYTVDGTATSGSDYTALSGSVVFPAGADSVTLNVMPVNDASSEQVETVRVVLSSSADYLINSAAANAKVSLYDDDTQVVSVAVTDATAQEVNLSAVGAVADTGTFMVTRSGDVSSALTIYYAFAGSSGSGVMALHGVDFEAMPGSVTIPAGQTQASITIIPRADGLGEGPEQVVLYLGAGGTNYVLGSNSSATVVINDNAADLPYADVISTGNATEGVGNGAFRITVRGGAGTGTLAVKYGFQGTATSADYSVSGSGNTSTGTTITLNNGATVTKDVTIVPTNDSDFEDLENVTLTLQADNAYQTFPSSSAASLWIKDNEYANTVYVDTQVGTVGSNTFTEGATTSPVKFYISRTGSTTASLVVNFTLAGSASSGSDYTAVSQSVTIPAGALGVDVPISILNDTVFEGTETITFEFAAGSYSRSPGTLMYVADNDSTTAMVGFATTSSSGAENVTSVNIPVTLNTAQLGTVTVQYGIGTTSGSNSTTVTPHSLSYWVRLVKSGDSVSCFESNDGEIWTQRGASFTVSGLGSSYLAGFAVASGSTTATTATLDSFSVTGLSPLGTTGALKTDLIGSATGGTYTLSSGMYSFASVAGTGLATNSAADNFCFVNMPVSNSANCTVTARLLSLGTTSSSSRIGVMLRSSTAQGSVYAASLATGATSSAFYPLNRAVTSGVSNTPVTYNNAVLPQWFRLIRSGNTFSTAYSKDGQSWISLSTSRDINPGPKVLAGLAVSAQSDGLIATGVFDNVSLDGNPVTNLQGRTVGFVNEQGSESKTLDVWTLNGSGAGIAGNSDEAHYSAVELSGDFTFVARLISLTNGSNNAQAGIMMRTGREGYARQVYGGFIKNGSLEQRYRLNGVTSAFGSGVDFTLNPGVLTFAPGVLTQDIVLNVTNDSVVEPNNTVLIQLSNAYGANINSSATFHNYTIVDDDLPPSFPYVGFAASSSSVSEAAGTVNLWVSVASPVTAAGTVDYAVTSATASGQDYTLSSGTLSFTPGTLVQGIPLLINDDAVQESAETVTVTLSNPVKLQLNSVSSHTVTINDNDLPAVNLATTVGDAAEAGLVPGKVTLTRTGDLSSALTVNLSQSGTATSGADFVDIPLTQTIQAGVSSLEISITPLDDSSNEGTETVILSLAAGSYVVGSSSSATINVLDNDRSTVSVVAADAVASETAGNTGAFTISRTAPTSGALTVAFTLTGTAANGTDYTNVPLSVSFAAGESSKSVVITPLDDALTEGDEQVTLLLSSGSYDIGAQSFANVKILDNDNPPTLFISSPGNQGPLIASGNGVILSATVSDDGAPMPVTQQWTQISGPGVATIETPTAATTAVTFSAPGTYILRIAATDTQFTVSDQVTVVVGSALQAADWITQDLGPSSARRGQSVAYAGQVTVSGTGAGYAGAANDQAHVMLRQISSDGSIVARLTSLSSSTALSGVTIRDSMARAACRAVLGFVPGSGLQFHARTSASATSTQVASKTGLSLPLWLRLSRNATTGEIVASYATETAGVQGSWTQLGATTVVPMDAAAHYGLTTTNNSASGTATAVFDNVTLTPVQTGPALLSEDATVAPAEAGSGSESSGTYTIVGSTTGYFYGWQYYGDMMVTARLASFSSGAGSSSGGIRVAESMENGAYLHLGRMPTSAYSGYYWVSLAGASSGGVPSSVSAGQWIRFVRKGNSITSYRAPDASGSPGTWVQIGQPQTIIMTTPVWVGFYVNNASGVGTNTCTFSGFKVEPLNAGPVVAVGGSGSWPLNPVSLPGVVTDDGYPQPVSLLTQWSRRSGPGTVSFTNAALPTTTANFSQAGAYVLRLLGDDGNIQTFKDVALTAYTKPFEVWQGQNWAASGGVADPLAAQVQDADSDGQANLLEYAFGTAPQVPGKSPVTQDTATVGGDKFLRLTIPKNPAASDVTYTVEASNSLGAGADWSSQGLVIESNTASQLIVRDNVPVASSGRRFMRVKVQQSVP